MYFKTKVDEVKSEVLFAIKERLSSINEERGEAINLKGFSVLDCNEKNNEYIFIQNLFLDDDDCLCCDYTSTNSKDMDSFIFGRNIENLCAEDLVRILNELFRKKWSDRVVNEEQQKKYDSILKWYLHKAKMFRKGA